MGLEVELIRARRRPRGLRVFGASRWRSRPREVVPGGGGARVGYSPGKVSQRSSLRLLWGWLRLWWWLGPRGGEAGVGPHARRARRAPGAGGAPAGGAQAHALRPRRAPRTVTHLPPLTLTLPPPSFVVGRPEGGGRWRWGQLQTSARCPPYAYSVSIERGPPRSVTGFATELDGWRCECRARTSLQWLTRRRRP